MSDKEMNLAILNKLYEIADKVFNEGVNVKEGNYTASDLAKMRDSAFKDGYLKTEKKSYKNECQSKEMSELIKVNQLIKKLKFRK